MIEATTDTNEPLLARLKRIVLDHPVLSVFTLAFFVRLLVIIFVTDYFSGSLVFDDSTYSLMAKQVVAGESHLWDPYTRSLYASTRTFLIPLVWVYRVVGPADPAGQMLVAMLGAGTAAVTTLIAREFLTLKWAVVAGGIVALLPSQVLWSSLTMKDAAVWFLLATIGLASAVANRSRGLPLLLLGVGIAALLFLLGSLREHTFVIAAWGIGIAAWAGIAGSRWERRVGGLIVAISIPWVIGFGPAGWEFITNHGDLRQVRIENAVGAGSAIVDPKKEERDRIAAAQQDTAEKVAEIQALSDDIFTRAEALKQARALQRAMGRLQLKIDELQASLSAQIAELQALQQEELLSLQRGGDEQGTLAPHVRHIPRGVSVMLFEPYPWQSSDSPSFTYAKAESLVWYPIVLLGFGGCVWLWRRKEVLAFPFLVGVALLFTYALTEGNLGTAFRHRGELVWIFALFAATGLAKWEEKRLSKRSAAGT